MKKLVLGLMAVLLMVGIACADELAIGDMLKKIPAMKQGIAYSFYDNDICYLSTIEVLKFKGVSLEAGYDSKDKAVAVLSYELLNLKKMGVEIPILDLISFQPGIFAGWGSINTQELDRSEFDWGISATILSVHF